MTSGHADNTRSIAAMAVAYFHCRVMTRIGIRAFAAGHHPLLSPDAVLAYLTNPFVGGPIGVPVFFVIGEYCIHRNHAGWLARNPQYRPDGRDFLWRRFVGMAAYVFHLLAERPAMEMLRCRASRQRMAAAGNVSPT